MEMIKAAKEGGFTLAEIKNLLDSWYSKSLSMEKKVAIVTNKISEIDNKIRQLKEVKNLLSDCILDIENGNC